MLLLRCWGGRRLRLRLRSPRSGLRAQPSPASPGLPTRASSGAHSCPVTTLRLSTRACTHDCTRHHSTRESVRPRPDWTFAVRRGGALALPDADAQSGTSTVLSRHAQCESMCVASSLMAARSGGGIRTSLQGHCRCGAPPLRHTSSQPRASHGSSTTACTGLPWASMGFHGPPRVFHDGLHDCRRSMAARRAKAPLATDRAAASRADSRLAQPARPTHGLGGSGGGGGGGGGTPTLLALRRL